ncbi:MAG: hypothetical protein ACI9GB_002198 [Halioglobus sp.]
MLEVAKQFGYVLVLSLAITAPVSSASTLQEAEVKATFLYYFFHYVSWGDGRPSNSLNAMRFCSLDRGEVFRAFEEGIQTSKGVRLNVEIVRLVDINQATSCDYIFISANKKAFAEGLLAAVSGRKILTVGDFEGFTALGGAIEMYREADRVRVRINRTALKNQQIVASSRLLKLADIVDDEGVAP